MMDLLMALWDLHSALFAEDSAGFCYGYDPGIRHGDIDDVKELLDWIMRDEGIT